MFRSSIKTPVGYWVIEGNNEFVSRIDLKDAKSTSSGTTPKAVATCVDQMSEYFSGARKKFTVPLEDYDVTSFQQDVWDALCTIPYGQVWTYGDVARAIKRPRAMRAVGNANNANPWPVLVPCHRVVASNHIGGYGSGGERVKRFLLEIEGLDYN